MRQNYLCCSGLVMFILLGCNVTQPAVVDKDTVSPIVLYTATLDKFGYLYYANKQQEVFKFDQEGTQQGYYSNNRLGNISIIDVTNPLKILIYFQDFFTGIFLDRQLNATSTFNMIDLGFGQIEVVASSLDGALWIFDDHEQRLNKVDQQGRVLRRGQDLRLLFSQRLRPNKIIEANGRLHLNVPSRGLLIFDLFGQYQTQLLLPDISDFNVIGDNVVYTIGDQLHSYSFDTHRSEVIWENPGGSDEKILWAGGDQIAIVASDGIKNLSVSTVK